MPLLSAFILFIAIAMIGMTIIAMNIWGPYMIEFKNFSDAFISVLFFQMGNYNMNLNILGILNFEFMKFYSLYWSFAYIITYCVIIVYILMSSFMMIFIDSFRRVNI